jgi:ketosteroid isomerase-like protein
MNKTAPGLKLALMIAVSLTLLSSCNQSSSTTEKKGTMKNDSAQNAAEEKIIRQRIDNYVAAIQAKNLEKVLEIFSPNLVSFDLEAPLKHTPKEAKQKNWTKAFAAYKDPLSYEVSDLVITISGDLATGRSLNKISGTLKNGRATSYWIRWTTCFQKIGGTWYITHDHVSVPMDVVTGKAVLNIEP